MEAAPGVTAAEAVTITIPNRDHIPGHVRFNAALGLPMVRQGEIDGANIVICAPGPSLLDSDVWRRIDDLATQGARIVAVKAAIGLLIDRGIVPDYAVAMDPGPGQEAKTRIHHRIRYLVAASCRPEFTARLIDHGCDVALWLCDVGFPGEVDLYRELFGPESVRIGGGLVIASRACSLMRHMGAGNIVMAGCDFGWRDDRWDGYAPGSEGKSVNERVRIRDRGRTDGCEWFSRADLIVSAVAMAREIKQGRVTVLGDSLAVALAAKDDSYLDALVGKR